MVFHTTTRRNAIIALVFICALVCGGLGWATWSAVQLDRHEGEDEYERAYNAVRNEAMANLDGLVASVLGVEQSRRFEDFRSYYWASEAYDARDGSEIDFPIKVPSPVRKLPPTSWVLLHFQASFTHGWSSPQLDDYAEPAMPASAIPFVDRSRQASAANWFAALALRHDPSTLLQLVEDAQDAELERREALAGYPAGASAGSVRNDVDSEPVTRKKRALSRTAAEFARRGERLVELQRAHFRSDQCEAYPVAVANLQAGDEPPAPPDPVTECVLVSGTPMFPVWLDLTSDGHMQLALVRSVTVENYVFCTLQGVLIDWNRLRDVLEKEIQDLLPGARIEPVGLRASLDGNMLRTIPARVVSPMPSVVGPATLSTGLTWGLTVTWVVTILALAAICYGTMKYVTLAERRMRFVAAVTHELRTPLTSFQLYTDLLADMREQDGRLREQYLETLRKESKRLARLVENVLVYSRIGDAKAAIQKRDITAQEVLDAIATETADQCQAAGKQLVVENGCPDDLQINTDREFVIQILASLVENACKYSADADDPRVWLSARPMPGEGVTFEVEDAGLGVPVKDRKAVFEPFRRSDSAQRGPASGLGLGLALSKYWATCLGGRLVLKRDERNGAHYSRFALSLPHTA